MSNYNEIINKPMMLLDPEAWVKEAMNRAKEYEGMPEAQYFLNEARRYMALGIERNRLEDHITQLTTQINELEEKLSVSKLETSAARSRILKLEDQSSN